jgi:TolB-like protein/DNA-binding winged helix-turn-helix (wHTH) protein
MSSPATGPAVIRFGEFTLDLRSGELSRNGGDRAVLPYQPFRLLATLVRRPGEVITREDLRLELWANDTYVDFEHSLNAAVRRLREALGDSAATPRFIETLPRRGYRFIAPVDANGTPQTGDAQTRERASDTGSLTAADVPEPTPAAAQITPSRRVIATRTLAYGGVIVCLGILAALGAWWIATPNQAPPPVIAVLPFQNLSEEPDSEYFVDGLTDEILRNLSVIEGLEVRSRTSSFTFKNKPRRAREVGEALQAGLFLEGSVLREGRKLRINAQLVRVADDVPLWSGRFDRQLEDVFAIQDEISRSIVNELRLALGGGQRRYKTNVEAYDLFLKARVLQARGAGTARGAIDLFEQVVTQDPAFAPAHAALASTYAYLSFLFPFEGGLAIHPDQAEPVMRRAALTAIELDPLLADAHAAMGNLHAVDRDWANAEASFRRALELNPSLTTTHTDFVLSTLFPQGKLSEAIQLLDRALRVDPLSLEVRRILAHVQINAGLYDRAIENCDRVLAADPSFPLVEAWRVRALMHKGRLSEAIRWMEAQGEGAQGYLGYAYAVNGRRVEAAALAARNQDFPQRQAMIYAGLGDADRAFDALERLAAVNPRRAGTYLTRPELASIQRDPRMAALRRKLGLRG